MSNNLETQTIYEIFRACRLCGAGGGYKMPIIPSVIGLECTGIELRQKIRECVQIEVNQDDKMPPLICELCVDKVNDFYEFLEMCKQTNKHTRLRLGLPMQTFQVQDNSDCILGVTEQIYDQDDEPLHSSRTIKIKREDKRGGDRKKESEKKKESDKKKENDRVKSLKKELENLIKHEGSSSPERRTAQREARLDASLASRRGRRSSPSQDTRDSRSFQKPDKRDRSDSLAALGRREQAKSTESPKLKPILKKEKEKPIEIIESEDDTPLVPRGKRPLTKAERKQEQSLESSPKKVKLIIKLPPLPPPSPPPVKIKISKAGPKSSKATLPAPVKPGPKSSKSSIPTPIKPDQKSSKSTPDPSPKAGPKSSKTPRAPSPKAGPKSSKTPREPSPKAGPKSSKIPCAPSPKAGPKSSKTPRDPSPKAGPKSSKTPRAPSPPRKPAYECSVCKMTFKAPQGLASHMRSHAEVTESTEKVAKIRKEESRKTEQRPDTPDGIETYNCSNCNKSYQSKTGLRKHSIKCSGSKKGVNIESGVKIAAAVLERLLPAQVRAARCDALLGRGKRKRYDVSNVPQDFDLDRCCVYPYRSLIRVKQEPFVSDGMVSIQPEIRNEFYREEDYVHWDSDLSSDSEDESLLNPGQKNKTVPSLTKLSLKTLFSKRCLGKVPRKLRKVKNDEAFDSLFKSDFDDVQSDVKNIINNFNNDDDNNEIVQSDISNLIDNLNSDIDANNDGVTLTADDATSIGGKSVSNNDNDSVNVEIKDGIGDVNSIESDSLLDDSKIDKPDNLFRNENPDNDLNTDKNIDNDNKTDASVDGTTENKLQSQSTIDVDESSQKEEPANNGLKENGSNGTNGLISDINDFIDDKSLIAELDAQIGETEKADQVSEKERNDRLILEDIVPKNDDMPRDLDNISDSEFNFDA